MCWVIGGYTLVLCDAGLFYYPKVALFPSALGIFDDS